MSEFLVIAERLMQSERRSLGPVEIVRLARERGMFSDKLAGKTLDKTMWEKLSRHIRRMGEDSTFIRTDRGRFYLRRLLDDPKKIFDPPPLRPPKPVEDVLVFPSAWLDRHHRFQGINQNWRRLSKQLLTPSVCHYMARIEAEQDNDHKQILTYILVTRQGQVLAYKRGIYNRVEDFLRGSHCVGFGGHVTFADRNLLGLHSMGIFQSAVRELSEELSLPIEDKRRLDSLEGLSLVGLLNDDSSSTGRRHFAFVMQYEVSNDPSWHKPLRGEKSITQLRWIDGESRRVSLWDFEYWSQLCLRAYFPDLVKGQPEYHIRRKTPLKPPHLLCVLGEIGSGKSEATRVLREDFGYVEINSGRVLAEILGISPVSERCRKMFQEEAWRFVSSPNGPETFARALWQRAKDEPSPRLLIDGIRQRTTLRELKTLANGKRIGLLFVHTLADVAYEFYKERSVEDCSIHDFITVRDSPVEEEVRGMIGDSDAVLYNWTGRVPYRGTIHRLMRDVGG